MNQERDIRRTVSLLVETYFSLLRRTVRKNLARLTVAFLDLALSVRFGYGGLHLTSVARVLSDQVKYRNRYKWLSRLLKCKYFDPSSRAECMLSLGLGNHPPPWVIVLVDQTTLDGVEVVSAAIPLAGRALPVAWVDFEYPWTSLRPPSQNFVELCLFTWLTQAAPPGVRLVLIFDRGYVRVALIRELNRRGQPFLMRGRKDVIVQAVVRGRRQRISLGRLPHRSGQPVRYPHVLYHSRQAEPVDVIVYRQKGFQDACFLIVPPDSESWLATDEVVRLYRQRMQIEHCFRDGKSHLGLRGLHLQVDKSQRLLRLLLAFTLAYLLVLLLGQDPLAEQARPYFEAPRRHPRHGTRKVLSALSVALCLLANQRWASQALRRFAEILSRIINGRGVSQLTAFSP